MNFFEVMLRFLKENYPYVIWFILISSGGGLIYFMYHFTSNLRNSL